MGRKLLWFLLLDAVLGPILMAGLCSMRTAEPPKTNSAVTSASSHTGTTTPRRATATPSLALLGSHSDPCALLKLAEQYGVGASGYADDITKAAAALPGAETPNPRAHDCSK